MKYENVPSYIPVEKGDEVTFQASHMRMPEKGTVESVGTHTVAINGKVYSRSDIVSSPK